MLKICSILVLNLLFCSALAAEDYPVGDKPFRRYVADGRDGKRITFYLSTQPAPSHPVPLIVWVQGTGCSSQFVSDGNYAYPAIDSVLSGYGVRGTAAFGYASRTAEVYPANHFSKMYYHSPAATFATGIAVGTNCGTGILC